MKHQKLKDIYSIFSKLSIITYPFHSFRYKNNRSLMLHLGSGKNIIPKFINIDSNVFRRESLWYDITLPLPFPNESVNVIYCSNVLEHFFPNEVIEVLAECRRILSKTGVFRIVVPDLQSAVKAYIDGSKEFFPDFPRKFNSCGGKLSNFLFCDGQHKYAYDFELMKEISLLAGFSACEKNGFKSSQIDESTYKLIEPFEEEYKNNNLFCELKKES